jgi:serine/threonine protein kinase
MDEDVFGIVGATLAGAFHVERVVAQGGFAVVYRGMHAGFRQPIALKCLRIPDVLTEVQRNTFLERFREEGELLFRLSAAISDVVRPLHIDAVQLPSGVLMPFLALEWLDGEGFDQVLLRRRGERKQGMDLLSLVDTLRPVAHALLRAHNFPTEKGNLCVVHRDLKPENLFMCSVAGVAAIKILDYGIAEVCSVAHQVSGARSWGGMNPFTPGYGAPEQWAPDRFGTCGPWTDVWGLALTMTEALIGKPAIDGERDAMRRTALDPRRRPTPRSLGTTVSNEVEKAFVRALALDPRDRTPDIETFWNEIEAAAGLSSSISSQRNSSPGSRRGPMRNAVLEIPDDLNETSIDLDLERAPESFRAMPRLSTPMPAPSRTPLPSVPPRGSIPSLDDVRDTALSLRDDPQGSRPTPSPGFAASSIRPSSPSSGSIRPSSSSRFAANSVRPEPPPGSIRPPSMSGSIRPSSPSGSIRPPSSRFAANSVRPEPPPGVVRPSFLPPPGRLPQSDLDPPPPRPGFNSEPDSPGALLLYKIKRRYKLPSFLLVAAIAITLLDLVMVRTTGEPISLGPARSFWAAGPLALIGALLLVWKIVAEE